MFSAEKSVMANMEWDVGFAMPVADSQNKQLENQVSCRVRVIMIRSVTHYVLHGHVAPKNIGKTAILYYVDMGIRTTVD